MKLLITHFPNVFHVLYLQCVTDKSDILQKKNCKNKICTYRDPTVYLETLRFTCFIKTLIMY